MCNRPVCLFAMLFISASCAGMETLYDPTRPPAAAVHVEGTTVDAAPPRLSAIITEAGERRAILNGVAVKPGDSTAGYEVAAIEPGRVKLRHNGALIELPLLPGVRKRHEK